MAEQRVERRLAAVLAADVAGYSRLMGADEEGTLARLNAHRTEFLEPTIAEYHGRVVKRTGDGILVEFGSAVDAARCAIKVQQGMRHRNADVAADQRIEIRVGIHIGDIIVEGGDIFGDGVNIAARLESIAEPGGICISDDAFRQVRGKIDATFKDTGEHRLKNIEQPVRVYQSELSGSEPQSRRVLALPDKPSIAVLAFNNMSEDPEQEYFSDGITEDIITGLSKNRGIFVIARNSSFAYKRQPIDVSRIGRELGVRYVLEGSVRRAGDRIRISAQLIEAEGRTHLWAERYDRSLTDLFAVQDEITDRIVATVAPELLEAEMQRVRRKEPGTLGAWECAMRAQWHLARMTHEDNTEAIRLAGQATALDPGTTLGLNIAAFAHLYAIAYGWEPVVAQQVMAAYQSASKAVVLDSRDAASHTALAACEAFIGRPNDAIARLQLALDLNPNFAWAHGNLGFALACLGRGDEAVASFNEALRLSPRDQFSFFWHYLLAFALFVAGKYEEALHAADKSLQENAGAPGAYRVRAASLSQLGRIDEAKSALADFLRLVPDATVASTKKQLPLKRPEDLNRYVEALKRAGLRDS
jgi:adenylate cyclase